MTLNRARKIAAERGCELLYDHHLRMYMLRPVDWYKRNTEAQYFPRHVLIYTIDEDSWREICKEALSP